MIDKVIKKLKELKVENCEMSHELIKREPDSIMPVTSTLPNDSIYLRGNLCKKDKRNHLGCAHTMCRSTAINLIDDLIKQFPQTKKMGKDYISSIKTIEWDIIQIDTKRQDAELIHANISKKICETPNADLDTKSNLNTQLDQAANNINKLINEHNKENEKIKKLHSNLINQLTTMIDTQIE